MCLLSLSYKLPNSPTLVVISNRDEFYARATEDMHWWCEEQDSTEHQNKILGGRDLVSDGTWLGVSKNKKKRFAAVLNFREGIVMNDGERSPFPKSRGSLATSFLLSSKTAIDWAADDVGDTGDYPGFNFICYGGQNLCFLSNRGEDAGEMVELEPARTYAISNGSFDSDDWPKVRYVRETLHSLVTSTNWNNNANDSVSESESVNKKENEGDENENKNGESENDIKEKDVLSKLVGIMMRKAPFPKDDLPDTGVGDKIEMLLSSPFIASAELGYGTRATTAIIIRESGELCATEHRFDQHGGTGCDVFHITPDSEQSDRQDKVSDQLMNGGGKLVEAKQLAELSVHDEQLS